MVFADYLRTTPGWITPKLLLNQPSLLTIDGPVRRGTSARAIDFERGEFDAFCSDPNRGVVLTMEPAPVSAGQTAWPRSSAPGAVDVRRLDRSRHPPGTQVPRAAATTGPVSSAGRAVRSAA